MSWTVEKIPVANSDYFETLNGLWKGKKGPFIETGVIRNTNFTPDGVIDYSNVAYLDVEEKQLSKRRLEPGDIILERSGGGPKQPVGRVVYFDREDGTFSFSNFTSTVRVKDKDTFDPRFVFYGLMELYQSGQTEDIQRRTTGIRNLDFTAYKERAQLPLLPLPEQKKIAHILSTVQRAIEAQDRIIQTTTELFKTTLHQLMTAQIRVSKEHGVNENPGVTQDMNDANLLVNPLPIGWKNYQFADICDRVKDSYTPVAGGKIPYVGLEHLAQDFPAFIGRGTESDIKSTKTAFKIGDILFGKLRPYLRKGAQANFNGISSTDILVFRAKDKCTPAFLQYLIHSDEFIAHAKSTTAGVQHPRTSWPSLRKFHASLPSLTEQERIAQILATIQKKIDNAQSRKTKLQDLFHTLLHELMTAKIRVKKLPIQC